MHSQRRREQELRAWCAQIGPGDGEDPRDEMRRRGRHDSKPDRKLRQLCKQVARALQMAMASLPEAEELTGAFVREVVPAPDAGRLCAVVVVTDPARRESVETVVHRHAGALRAEIAQVISRRRVPELTFWVVVEGGDSDG